VKLHVLVVPLILLLRLPVSNVSDMVFAMVDPHSTSPDWQKHNGSEVILPVGAFEQHGDHMPLDTDNLLAEHYCRWLAESLDAALLPALRFGTSMEHRGFRGSISLRPETLMQVIRDIADEVELQGFRILVVASFHGGNHCLVPVIRDINRGDRSLKVIHFFSGDHWPGGIAESTRDRDFDIHAGEAETSAMLAAYPELVREERTDMSVDKGASIPLKVNDLTTFGMGVVNATGVLGRPSLATAEKGERMLAGMKESGLAWLKDRIARLEENPRYAGAGGIAIREMRPDDIPSGIRIKEEAGWNQTESDWQLFLQSDPQGCYAAVHMGGVVGTVSTLKFANQLAWIGMVLVDPEFRGMKIATRLMRRALDYLNGSETVKLDATPAGREVYGELGFKEEWGLSRMTTAAVMPVEEVSVGVSVLESVDVVAALDIEAFGVDRRPVLTSLLSRAPSLAWTCGGDGRDVSAFCFGRPGTQFSQIGPIVSRDEESARQVIVAALHQLRGRPAVIDVPDCHEHMLGLLAQHGFSKERPFTRMFKGPNATPGSPELVFASAGPELG
jgi:creatinine amidohydrolase/Fe(II)-dependent formamide hydrolase-like protein/GNAT superfamily N-acetyltransferase